MIKSEEAEKFSRYCNQLEKYGHTENVHSPVMAMLRRKARKQLIALMKQEIDCTTNINKLWIVGYYHPFQFYIREDDGEMETTTLLTMFCGELQEMLSLGDEKYVSLWNMFIGDLHRYMPDGEVQKFLAAGYYTQAIKLDPKHGRAYHALSMVIPNLTLAQKLRLMILGQLAEIPYKKSLELTEFLKSNQDSSIIESSEKFLIDFVSWALDSKSKRIEHQLTGLKLIQAFKSVNEEKPNSDWPMNMSVCRLATKLANKNFGFQQFTNCFDAISAFYLTIYSKSAATNVLLSEAISWICDVGYVFGSDDPLKKEPFFLSLSVFAKTKWNELNDLVMEHINTVFTSESLSAVTSSSPNIGFVVNGPKTELSKEGLSQLVHSLLSLNHPTMELITEDEGAHPLLRRINQSEQKRLDIPIEALAEKVSQLNREDWRPVYVLMDFDTILNEINIARKIWDIDDFICILPSTVLDQLDNQKTKIKAVRPVIRSLMELQAKGKITLKKCDDERHCAEQLVQSAKGSSKDHKHIVAFLCKNYEGEKPMEGVTFYDIQQFYTKYLE